jgi:hypothetical protein
MITPAFPRLPGRRCLFFATDHLVVLQIFRPAPIWVVATWIGGPELSMAAMFRF